MQADRCRGVILSAVGVIRPTMGSWMGRRDVWPSGTTGTARSVSHLGLFAHDYCAMFAEMASDAPLWRKTMPPSRRSQPSGDEQYCKAYLAWLGGMAWLLGLSWSCRRGA